MLVQLRFATGLSSEEYVSERHWEKATLERCPLHPAGGCGISKHGTYEHKRPAGARIARWYCRASQTTIGLIPDCLASQIAGELDEIESAVVEVEGGRSIERVAEELRDDVELPGAIRWLRRRIDYVERALSVARGLSVEVLTGSMPTLRDLRDVLGRGALVRLRALLAEHLAQIAPPLGFAHRSRMRERSRDGPNNRWGRLSV